MELKNIFLFGASGQTGRQLLQQALDIGHKVTALARTPGKLDEFTRYENFKIIKGDALQRESFEEDMANMDVVISCLGSTTLGRFSGVTIFTESFNQIHEAMKSKGVERFIAMSSWGTEDRPELSFFIRWILKPLFLKSVLQNLNEMEHMVEKTDLNYTIVRPGGLKNEPSSGHEIIAEENGQCVSGCASGISRADVAAFMLKCMQTSEFDKKILAIGRKP